MKQTSATDRMGPPVARRRPWRTCTVVVAAMAVGVAGLAQAGILAPNLWASGGGSGGRPDAINGWVTLQNVSWRAWTVTGVRAPSPPGMSKIEVRIAATPDGAAALRVAQGWGGNGSASGGDTNPATRPISLPRGGVLLVYVSAVPSRRCAPGNPGTFGAARRSMRVRPVLSFSTPLGTRHIMPSVFLNACHT